MSDLSASSLPCTSLGGAKTCGRDASEGSKETRNERAPCLLCFPVCLSVCVWLGTPSPSLLAPIYSNLFLVFSLCSSAHLLAALQPTTTCNSLPAHAIHPALLSLLPSASATSSPFFPSPFPAALTTNPLNPFAPASASALGSTSQIITVDTQRIDLEGKEEEVRHAAKTSSLRWNSISSQQSFHCHSIIRMLFTAFHFYLLSSNVCFCCLSSSGELPIQFQKLLFLFIQDDKLYSPGSQKTRSAGTHLARPPNSRLDLM